MKYTQEEIIKANGPYKAEEEFDFEKVKTWIQEISTFPGKLRSFYESVPEDKKKFCYREGGWTSYQVIHHIADSHAQALQRFKLTLTEDNPTIKPYSQNAWAETADAKDADPMLSIQLIEALHARWRVLMDAMDQLDFTKTYFHPEQNKTFTLWWVLGLYAWHGKHHLTQMKRYAINEGLISENE